MTKNIIDKHLSETALSKIRQAMAKLMHTQYFYYNIASQFRLKEVSPSECPTMGVAYIDGVHWMVYNAKFINYYEFKELAPILDHEISHFTFDHVKHFESKSVRKSFKDEDEAKDAIRKKAEDSHIARLKNICTDRSINVYLHTLPNIRESVADAKAQFTDKEGNFNEDKYTEHMTKMFNEKRQWFKDPTLTLATASDEDILESPCITEESFKRILTEAGYKGDVNAVKKYETWKYYFDLLMNCPKTKEAIQNIKDMDVHFAGDEEDERQAEQARDRIMIDAAQKSNKSDIPGHLRNALDMILERNKEKPLPWNIILRRCVESAKRSIIKNDINTRNRYYGGDMIIPGYKPDPIKDIAVIWDVSGSCMDDETQSTFVQEVNGMIKAGSQVRCYYTDAAVEHVQDCKDRLMKPAEYEIKGGGGTDMDPAIRQAIAEGYRIIINLTDCYVPYNMTKRELKGRKVITVSTTDSKSPEHYGPTIHVNPN